MGRFYLNDWMADGLSILVGFREKKRKKEKRVLIFLAALLARAVPRLMCRCGC